MGKQWKQRQTLFWGAPKSLQMVTAAMKLKDTPWKKSFDQPRQHIKKKRHYFVDKDTSSQSYGFSSSHVWMWELDYKESWAPTNWCFWTVVLEKTLESPLDCKGIQLGDLFEKTLMLAKIESRRRRGPQRMRWLDGITDSMDRSLSNSGSWWWTGKPCVLQFMGSQRVKRNWSTEMNIRTNLGDLDVDLYRNNQSSSRK